MRTRRSWLLVLFVLVVGPESADAARRDVLLVVNARVPDSRAVAEAYRSHRDIPADHVVELDLDPVETITRAQYQALVESKVAGWIEQHAAQDEITYIVLTRGVPLKVRPDAATRAPLVSVDSLLTLLYRRLAAVPVGVGPLPNPMFIEQAPAAGWPGLDRATHDLYLVARLDGFTTADATRLAQACPTTPVEAGRVVLDGPPAAATPEHRWLPETAERLRGGPTPPDVDLDQTRGLVEGGTPVIGYFAWGARDVSQRRRAVAVPFAPGAIGASLSSSDARTLVEPPAGWVPGAWGDRARWYDGSADWLAGDVIRAGVTGWAASVADPYVDGIVRPHVLLPAYLAGRSLGEAFYLATKYVSWRTVVFGDPLCRPFGAEPPPATFTRDEQSGLTTPFRSRLLERARQAEPRTDVASLETRIAAQARLAQGDRERALALLREWTATHADDLAAQRMLALTLDATKERDEAIAVYRRVLQLQPADVVVSNNLAYALAVDPAHRDEALALSRRAYESSRAQPMIADTYGWVLYQVGDLPQAARVLEDTVRTAPALVDARVHLALTYLKAGNRAGAREQWDAALKLDPTAGDRAEASALVEAFREK